MNKIKSKAKAQTWINNLKNGLIKNKTMRIYEYIYKNPNVDIDQARKMLNISHQTLTAIISGLMDEGVVKIMGEIKIGDNVYSQFRAVIDIEEAKILKEKRGKQKFVDWIKMGLNNFDKELPKNLKQALSELKDYQYDFESPYLRPSKHGGFNFPEE